MKTYYLLVIIALFLLYNSNDILAQTKEITKLGDALSANDCKKAIKILEKPITMDSYEVGWNLLFSSMRSGCKDVAELLIKGYINLDFQDLSGNTILMNAVDSGNIEIVKLLLENGAKVDLQIGGIHYPYGTALMIASDKGYLEIIKLLLDYGANINLQSEHRGYTPLMVASDSKVTKLLLDEGAKIDLQKNSGQSALMFASEVGKIENAILLLEKGANVNLQSYYGTALVQASENRHNNIVKLLLDNEANVDLPDLSSGKTALIWASEGGDIDIVKLLLEKGANVDLQDSLGETALIKSSINGHDNIVKALLDKGANKFVLDNGDKTALDYASNEVIETILAPVNIKEQEAYKSTDIKKSNIIGTFSLLQEVKLSVGICALKKGLVRTVYDKDNFLYYIYKDKIPCGIEVQLIFENIGKQKINSNIYISIKAETSPITMKYGDKLMSPIAVKGANNNATYHVIKTKGGAIIQSTTDCIDGSPASLRNNAGGHLGLICTFCIKPGEKDILTVMFEKPDKLSNVTFNINCPLCPAEGIVIKCDL